MLKKHQSQAAGLLDMALHAPTRLIAMVCHGDERAELRTLWHLCGALTAREWQVTVLDGTKSESLDNPGLAQILDFSYWNSPTADDDSAWQVLPARIGLEMLSMNNTGNADSAIYQWGHFFSPNAMVVVYAPVGPLSALVRQTGVQPLLALSNGKTSLMTSYLALKRIAQQTGVVPTVVQVAVGHTENENPDGVSRSLQECARHFLQLNIDVQTVDPENTEPSQSEKFESLVNELLLGSVTLEAPWMRSSHDRERDLRALATRTN